MEEGFQWVKHPYLDAPWLTMRFCCDRSIISWKHHKLKMCLIHRSCRTSHFSYRMPACFWIWRGQAPGPTMDTAVPGYPLSKMTQYWHVTYSHSPVCYALSQLQVVDDAVQTVWTLLFPDECNGSLQMFDKDTIACPVCAVVRAGKPVSQAIVCVFMLCGWKGIWKYWLSQPFAWLGGFLLLTLLQWTPGSVLSIRLTASSLATSAGLYHRSGLIAGTKLAKSPSTAGQPCSLPSALSASTCSCQSAQWLSAAGSGFSLFAEPILAKQFRSSACSHLKTIKNFHLQSNISFKPVPLLLSLCLLFLFLPLTLLEAWLCLSFNILQFVLFDRWILVQHWLSWLCLVNLLNYILIFATQCSYIQKILN